MEEEYQSSNIHEKWLESLFEQIKNIQAMQRIAREGATNLMEYMQIPMEMQPILLADIEYKNLRFLVLEMDLLVSNLSNVLKEKTQVFHDKINKVIDIIDNRELFIKDRFRNGQLMSREAMPLFYETINYIFTINAQIIADISHILYIPEEDNGKKKW